MDQQQSLAKLASQGWTLKDFVHPSLIAPDGSLKVNLKTEFLQLLVDVSTVIKSKWAGCRIVANTYHLSDKEKKKYGREPYYNRGIRVHRESGKSAHEFGLAIDFDVYRENGTRITPAEVRTWIMGNLDKIKTLRAMELDVNWVHIDCMFNQVWRGKWQKEDAIYQFTVTGFKRSIPRVA